MVNVDVLSSTPHPYPKVLWKVGVTNSLYFPSFFILEGRAGCTPQKHNFRFSLDSALSVSGLCHLLAAAFLITKASRRLTIPRSLISDILSCFGSDLVIIGRYKALIIIGVSWSLLLLLTIILPIHPITRGERPFIDKYL